MGWGLRKNVLSLRCIMKQSFRNSQSGEISRFVAKTLILALIVILPLIGVYIWLDPYRFIRTEAAFLPNPSGEVFGEWEGKDFFGPHNSGHLYLNNYLKQLGKGHNYTGFIFGASISQNVTVDDWRNAASIPDSIEIIHLGTDSESLMFMGEKVKYLDRNNVDIRYALLIMDANTIKFARPDGIANINPPVIPPETPLRPFHPLIFHYKGFRAVMNIPFIASYIPSVLNDTSFSVRGIDPLSPAVMGFDGIKGEESPRGIERLRHEDYGYFRKLYPLKNQDTVSRVSTRYTLAYNNSFDNIKDALADSLGLFISGEGIGNYLEQGFPSSIAAAFSTMEHRRLQKVKALEDIAEIFSRHNTEFMVFIPPTSGGAYIGAEDLEMLYCIFGKDRVKCLDDEYKILSTDSMMLDGAHFSPAAGRYLIRKAYGKTPD